MGQLDYGLDNMPSLRGEITWGVAWGIVLGILILIIIIIIIMIFAFGLSGFGSKAKVPPQHPDYDDV